MDQDPKMLCGGFGRWFAIAVICIGVLTGAIVAIYAVIRPQPYDTDRDFTAEFHALMRKHAGITKEEDNRRDLFSRVLIAVGEVERDVVSRHGLGSRSVDLMVLIEDSSTEASRAAANDAIAAMEATDVFAMLQDLAADPRAVPGLGIGMETIDSMMGDLSAMRMLTRAIHVRQTMAMLEGDVTTAIDCLSQRMALARVANATPLLISYLTGAAMLSWGYESALELAKSDGVNADHLLRISHALTPPPPLRPFLEGERLWALQHIANTPPSPIPVLGPNPKLDAAQMEEFFDIVIAYHEGKGVPQLNRGETPDGWANRRFRRYGMASILAPSIVPMLDVDKSNRTRYAGTVTLLAIEAYYMKHSRYPAALTDLVPGILSQLPDSPYDPIGLVYRLPSAEDDLTGRPYLLYSIGIDGVDNGGLQHPESAHNGLVRDKGSGYDFVFGRTGRNADAR